MFPKYLRSRHIQCVHSLISPLRLNVIVLDAQLLPFTLPTGPHHYYDHFIFTFEVEYVVMRALSLNLMKGRIDEVNQCVTLTWLQPRVLDLDQVRFHVFQDHSWGSSFF